MTATYDASTQLLGAYFHQDWSDEFESDVTALRAIVAGEPAEAVQAAAAELRVLLARNLSESDLEDIALNRIGVYFDPGAKGQTYRQWLDSVAAALAAEG